MAIIKPARKFSGSEMSVGDLGKYVVPGIPQVVFNKNTNKEGVWLYIMPAYKLDSAGNGAWYKVFKVRDNFGDRFKDKYVIQDPNDPVSYFEKNFKLLYPDEAKPIEVEENGRKMKRYPLYGRIATRVVYNVALCQNLEAGVHILDLPNYNGADQIEKYHSTPDVRGNAKGLICDPDKCIPMFVKLNDGGGSPWQILFDATQATQLPPELVDSESLHDLDSIFVKKDARELIAKLKEMYRPDIFEECMDGYPGGSGHSGGDMKVPRAAETQQFSKPAIEEPPVKQAPAVSNIPKSKVPAKGVKTDSTPAIPTERVESSVNPMMGADDEDAAAFLRS